MCCQFSVNLMPRNVANDPQCHVHGEGVGGRLHPVCGRFVELNIGDGVRDVGGHLPLHILATPNVVDLSLGRQVFNVTPGAEDGVQTFLSRLVVEAGEKWIKLILIVEISLLVDVEVRVSQDAGNSHWVGAIDGPEERGEVGKLGLVNVNVRVRDEEPGHVVVSPLKRK